MNENMNDTSAVGRRDFFKVAGAGVTAAAALLTPQERAVAQGLEEKARLRAHRRVHLADPSAVQDARGQWPGKRAAQPSRRSGCGAVPWRAVDSRESRSDDSGGDEAEVRRDHDAGLPAVDEGALSGRHADGFVLRPVWRRRRRHDVHDRGRGRRRRRWVQSDESIRTQVARSAGRRSGQDGYQGAAHLEQRAIRPRGLRIPRKPTPDAKPAWRWPSAGSRAAPCSA